MKRKFNYLLLSALAVMSLGFVSCSDDDFTATIFDTTEYPLDRKVYTFPLDTFVKVNFQEPYNLRFIHRMEDIASDKTKNLVPASYDKACELAVLVKYLWYDVYNKLAPENFLQENSPRIIHVIGSKNYNVSQGTEVLGVAEGGLKISLYNVNNLNVADMDNMNKYFFKTMHHEFGHILDQTRLHPSTFNTISTGFYNPSSWQDVSDSLSLGNGFITSYASSSTSEDLVETLANYVTMDQTTWERSLNTASYEWEEVDYKKEIFEDKKRVEPYSNDTIGYFVHKDNGNHKIIRRTCLRNNDDAQTVILNENGEVQWLHTQSFIGRDVILQKLEIVRSWLKENFGVDIDELRAEVQNRSYVKDSDGNFIINALGRPVNKLTYVVDGDPEGRTLIEVLLDEINKYKELQQ